MTPRKRAKFIFEHCFADIPNSSLLIIETQIKLAIQEAVEEAYTKGCADTIHNSPNFEDAIAAQREADAKIATEHIICVRSDHQNCPEEIAAAIRGEGSK